MRHHIALWDVVAACDIKGSSDRSIRNVIPTDLNRILRTARIETILANGDTAFQLYRKYCRETTGREAVKYPSTSPANAFFTLDRLAEAWGRAVLTKAGAKPGSKFPQNVPNTQIFLAKGI